MSIKAGSVSADPEPVLEPAENVRFRQKNLKTSPKHRPSPKNQDFERPAEINGWFEPVEGDFHEILSRGTAAESSPRCQPWGQTQIGSSPGGAKEIG